MTEFLAKAGTLPSDSSQQGSETERGGTAPPVTISAKITARSKPTWIDC